jgi:hypothetical protein
MAVELGLVKFFSVEKRFGFLVIPGAPKSPADVFFHAENGRRIALHEGEMRLLRNPERIPRYRDAVVLRACAHSAGAGRPLVGLCRGLCARPGATVLIQAPGGTLRVTGETRLIGKS